MRVHSIAALMLLAVAVAGCAGLVALPSSLPSLQATPGQTLAPTVAPSQLGAYEVSPSVANGADPALVSAIGLQAPVVEGVIERVETIRQSGDFAVIVSAPTTEGWVGEGYIVLAWRDASGWHLAPRSDTEAFCAALSKAPPGAVAEAERAYLVECL